MTGIELNNVSFSYHDDNRELNHISLHIATGDFWGIVGSNGSGKSTLINLLNGLIPQEVRGQLNGVVLIDGVNTRTKPVSYFARSVGMLFQNPDFMLFNLTVAEEIEFGLKNLRMDNRSEKIDKALTQVGLSGFENRDPQSLSLGQKQKVALACILAADTRYIVLDEPAAMLDYKSTHQLYELLVEINHTGKTIIVVEHDTDYLLNNANKIAVLDKGQLVYSGTPQSVFSHTKKLQALGIKIPVMKK